MSGGAKGGASRRRRGIAGESRDTGSGNGGRKKRGTAGSDAEESRGGWGETLRSVAWAVVLFLILRTFVLQTFFITSGSMEDTMLIGDFLVVNKVATGSRVPFTDLRIPGYSERRRGEILIFDPRHEEGIKLVKRLVGLPGDTLEMRNRVLYIDGERQEEPYVRHIELMDLHDPDMMWQLNHLAPGVDGASYRPTRDDWGPIVIPEDRYFFLGDNREESQDSRYWGLIEGWRIEGRASFIYFSYDRESLALVPFVTEVRWGRIFQGYH